MAELTPIPFEVLVRRALEEWAHAGSVFDLPERSFHRPDPALDTSVQFQGRAAGTPVGPASGPHTQLAQNLVLSWLGGGRVLELKTVQVNDRLNIARPCIHVPNLGYNVEWSQELRIEESLGEYVKGAMLIEILAAAGVAGPRPEGARGAVQFDLSLGYGLEGIRSDAIRRFVARMKDARAEVEAFRARIPDGYARWRELPFPADLAHNVTLSTFHGCPADEIESIVHFLLTELDLDVVVKMNPTLIGRERAKWLLHDVLGYRDLQMNPVAFERDLGFEAAAAMIGRQQETARARGRRLGVKMSNTLEVLNPGDAFRDAVVYLSGQPLHVIALHGVELWRAQFGPDLPISFSAGADAQNFPGLVALDLVPVTTCTDLLRPGGYSRLPKYLARLEERMRALGVQNVPDYVIKAGGHGAVAIDEAAAELRRRYGVGAGVEPAGGAILAALAAPPAPAGDVASRGRCVASPPAWRGAAGDAASRGSSVVPLAAWPEGAVRAAERALAVTVDRLGRELTVTRADLADALAEECAEARDALAGWGDHPRTAKFLADLSGLRDRARALAGVGNTADLVASTRSDPRYGAARNRAVPRRIDSRLVLFDCISCDKCIPVCPNDAVFRYTLPEVAATWVRLTVAGGRAIAGEPREFRIARGHQIACYADACNECGNCDTFCPETGGPYLQKPRMFGSRESFERWRTHDGFFIEKDAEGWSMVGRIHACEYRLRVPHGPGMARFDDGLVTCEMDGFDGNPRRMEVDPSAADGHALDLEHYCAMRAILEGMRNPDEVHFVNACWR